MAKRPANKTPDPFDDDAFDDEEIDASDIDNLRLSAEDLDDSGVEAVLASEGDPDRVLGQIREPLTAGRLIVGAIKVIVIAVIALVIFAALAFGAVFGGQKIGLVPTREATSALLTSLLPTSAPPATATPVPPTAAPAQAAQPNAPTNAPAAGGQATASGCASAAAWWSSQQIQSNYQYFTQQALNDARSGTQPLSAVLNQMGIHSSFVANVPHDPCVNDALNALTHDFDAITDVARVVGSSDQSSLEQKQAAADQAAAALTVALWSVGVSPTSGAAVPDPATKGQGASCGAQTWYSGVKAHVDAFNQAAAKVTPSTSGSDAKTLTDTMQTERGSVAAVSVPACATSAQQALLASLDADLTLVKANLAGNTSDDAAAQSTYDQQNQLFVAWQQWLGMS